MQAVLFIGVQGSGKSTFYGERFSGTHVHINLDMLRTWRREQILLAACIEAKESFVMTTPMRWRAIARATFRSRAAEFQVIAYFFETTLAEAMRRNNERCSKQKIPAAALAGTFSKLQPPRWEEGFDEIHTVSLSRENAFRVERQSGEQLRDRQNRPTQLLRGFRASSRQFARRQRYFLH